VCPMVIHLADNAFPFLFIAIIFIVILTVPVVGFVIVVASALVIVASTSEVRVVFLPTTYSSLKFYNHGRLLALVSNLIVIIMTITTIKFEPRANKSP